MSLWAAESLLLPLYASLCVRGPYVCGPNTEDVLQYRLLDVLKAY